MTEAALRDLVQSFADHRKQSLLVIARPQLYRDALPPIADLLAGKKFKELDIMLITGSGSTDFALRLLRLLGEHATKLTACIPYRAQSAGTQVALGCHALLMGEMGFLGPIDTMDGARNAVSKRMEYASTLEIAEGLREMKRILARGVRRATGELRRRTDFLIRRGWHMTGNIDLLYETATELVTQTLRPLTENTSPHRMARYDKGLEENTAYARLVVRRGHPDWSDDQVNGLIDSLAEGYADHNYVITQEQLSRLGVEVSPMRDGLREVALEIAHRVEQDLEADALDLIELFKPKTGP